jgi:hypothetical protein
VVDGAGVSGTQAGIDAPKSAQQYLKRAAGRDAHLRAELHANLHQRMLDHQSTGLPEQAAWDAALLDFGPAAPGWHRPATLLLALGSLGALASAAATHLGLQ